METWKDIPGYEGLYKVSDQGNVMSLDNKYIDCTGRIHHTPEKILNPVVNGEYLSTSLSKCKKKKGFLIHRLVAAAFIPNPKNKPEVNHIDGNKHNNYACNLEWNDRSENMIHCYRVLKRKPPNFGNTGIKNKTRRPVLQYSKDDLLIKEYISIKDAAKQIGCSEANLSDCLRGITKTAFGFKWKYKFYKISRNISTLK